MGCGTPAGRDSVSWQREPRVATTSWLGSVWSLRGEDQLLIGQVRAIDGEVVILSVVGLSGAAPDGLEVLPVGEEGARLARVRSSTLLCRWRRMGSGETVPA